MKQDLQKALLAILFCLTLCSTFQCKKSGGGSQSQTNNPPAINSVTPDNGIVGTPITLAGTNLEKATKITFNGVAATKIVSNTNAQIVVVVPTGADIGINKIKIQNSYGTSNEANFEVFKTPDQVDSFPPTLTQVIPSTNYSGYPVLIYGDNLSGVVKLTFNGKDAQIYTNIKNVITATVPDGLSVGAVTIEVTTLKGKQTIKFQTQGPPTNAASINFSVITLPPINYVPGISNQWSCGLFSQTDGDQSSGNFVDLNSDTTGNQDYAITGWFKYHYDKTKNYNDINFIQIINHSTNDTLAGQFSSEFNNPCVLHMVLISSKFGTIDTCVFDKRSNDPTLNCEE